MIERIYGKNGQKMVLCDNCGDGFEAEDFFEAKEQMFLNGWQTKRVDGTYKHFCEDCKDD